MASRPNPSAEPYELPVERARAISLWLAETKTFVERIGIPERYDEVVAALEVGKPYRRCFGEWEGMGGRHRRRRWEELCRATERAAYQLRPYCLRCGDCCRAQSPALHAPDLPLIREGVIGRHQLFTLRRGERAYSAQKGTVVVLPQERVKVRQLPSGSCPFYEADSRACAIYDRRPLECRALKCWEPEAFGRDTRSPHLRRQDILEGGPLAELVRRHEREIDLALVGRAAEGGDPQDQAAALKLLPLDEELRRQAVEGCGADPGELEFLFGGALRDLLADLLRRS
jgi:Fe-S-cluster containining protein